MWKELLELEERIRLVDGCASGEEYHYHMPGQHSRFPIDQPHTRDRFGTSGIMEEERRKIIVVGKHPKEAVVEQAPREVLSPNTLIPSRHELTKEWELVEEACAKARGIARKRLEAEGERCSAEGMAEGSRRFLLQLLEMDHRAHRAEARREEVEKAVANLRSALEVAHDDAEEVLLLK